MKIDELIARETAPHVERLWGAEYVVSAALVREIHGDGQSLLRISPLATRPQYYIMRVDSSVIAMVEDDGDEIHDFIEEVVSPAIAESFGDRGPEDEDWPAWDDDCGLEWEIIE